MTFGAALADDLFVGSVLVGDVVADVGEAADEEGEHEDDAGYMEDFAGAGGEECDGGDHENRKDEQVRPEAEAANEANTGVGEHTAAPFLARVGEWRWLAQT